MSNTDLEHIARQLDADDNYRVVRRLPIVKGYADAPGDDTTIRTGIYLDVETTGFDEDTCKIIELAMLKFEFSSDGRIYSMLEEYDEFNDPGAPIPAEIVTLTGITDDMVRDKHIDTDEVCRFIANCNIIVAHNAAFDRRFVEAHLSGFDSAPWGCSQSQVGWREAGFESSKLEYLAYRQGFFYAGHRAITDCRAGIHLLAQPLPDGSSAFAQLLDDARRKHVRIYATGSPFESKDILRMRGYRWNPGDNGHPKAWYRDIEHEKLDEEMAFLAADIYGRQPKLPVVEINPFNRFSTRI